MKRIELFEFEDFDWFPNQLRSYITGLIKVLLEITGKPIWWMAAFPVNGLGVNTEGDILGLSPGDTDDPNAWGHK